MSRYLQIDTVATAISGLIVTGVTIGDLEDLRNGYSGRDCPTLVPGPNYLSAVSVERVSFGDAANARKTITYALTYRYLHAPAGAGRQLGDVYLGLLDNLDLILSAAIDYDTLSDVVIDITPRGATAPGVVSDAANNNFFGCDIVYDVTIFVR